MSIAAPVNLSFSQSVFCLGYLLPSPSGQSKTGLLSNCNPPAGMVPC